MRRLVIFSMLFAMSSGTACVENDQSIVIHANTVLNKECMVDVMPVMAGMPSPFRPRGLYDLGIGAALNKGFVMIPRVINQLPARAAMGGIETNNVTLVGFDVDIIPDPGQRITDEIPPDTNGLTRLNVPYYGGQLTAGGGIAIGSIEVISPNLAVLLLSRRAVKPGPPDSTEPYQTVTVRLRARTLFGGGVLFSQWVEFPVSLCAYCLAIMPGENTFAYNPGTGSLRECPDASALSEESLLSSCLPQQDDFVTCCLKERQILCGKSIPHRTD